MVFPNVLRAMEEFSVFVAHKQLPQALLMDCTAHTAEPRATACLELLLLIRVETWMFIVFLSIYSLTRHEL